MKNRKKTTYQVLLLTIFILIGISILSVALEILSMGDNVNHKQVELNRIINNIIGFPIEQFKDGFPLLLNNTDFWKANNLILLFLNTLIQASGIVLIGKFIRKKINSTKKN